MTMQGEHVVVDQRRGSITHLVQVQPMQATNWVPVQQQQQLVEVRAMSPPPIQVVTVPQPQPVSRVPSRAFAHFV